MDSGSGLKFRPGGSALKQKEVLMSLIRSGKAEKKASYRVGIQLNELHDRMIEKRIAGNEHISRNEHPSLLALKERESDEALQDYPEHAGMCGFATGMDYIKQPSNNREMSISESHKLGNLLESDELFRKHMFSDQDIEKCMQVAGSYGLSCTKEDVKEALENFRKDDISEEARLFSLWGNRIDHVRK